MQTIFNSIFELKLLLHFITTEFDINIENGQCLEFIAKN